MRSNEKEMSDGGREGASLRVEVWKSSQKWSGQRSAVRSIAWLDLVTICDDRRFESPLTMDSLEDIVTGMLAL